MFPGIFHGHFSIFHGFQNTGDMFLVMPIINKKEIVKIQFDICVFNVIQFYTDSHLYMVEI